MKDFKRLLSEMRQSPGNVRYEELKALCINLFGPPRQSGGSHAVFKTPWQGNPRVNIQVGKNGKAKKYQVKQVLAAIERLLAEEGEES